MPKIRLGMSVLDAARERISFVFDNFPRVYVSFSAGKDSTVMLHLVADEAIKRGRKFGVLLVDLEGQYRLTMEHAAQCIAMYKDNIELYWICLPIHLRNAVSVYQPHWICWEPESKEAWIRTPPDCAITDPEALPFFAPGMEFEEFVPAFGEWYSQGEQCACLVGIRSDESLNRYRTIAGIHKEKYQDKRWTTLVTEHVYNAYPIYDWRTQDIWTYHAKNPDKPYNELYNRMHLAGVPLGSQRICQPYGDDQRRGLWLFHLIEPETWARVVARVNGANGGALYVQEWGNINGYRRVTKPEGHTWQSFAELLIESMPPKTKEHYRAKLWVFVQWWGKRGYPQGIPDEADYALEAKRRAPSWRRICKSLLRNDYWCKGLSFTQHKSAAYTKYLQLINRKKSAQAEISFEVEDTVNDFQPIGESVIAPFRKEAIREGLVFCGSPEFYGCYRRKRLVGFFAIQWYAKKAAFKNAYTIPNFRGQGVHDAMLKYAKRLATERGCKLLEASATPQALSAHLRNGAVVVAECKSCTKVQHKLEAV